MWKNVFRAPGVLGETQAARNRYQFSAAAPTGKQTSRNNETRRQFPQQKPINLSLLTRGEIVHFSQTAYFKLTVSVCFSTAEMKHHPWQLLLLSKFGYISLKLDQKACFIKKYAYLLCTFFWRTRLRAISTSTPLPCLRSPSTPPPASLARQRSPSCYRNDNAANLRFPHFAKEFFLKDNLSFFERQEKG